MPEPHRVALYYAPAADDPLWLAGCAWLGRNPETGTLCERPALPNLEATTTDPQRYGFHATLKAPMQRQGSFAGFLEQAASLAARQHPFRLPPLEVRNLHGFLALCLTEPCPELQALADACVTGLDSQRRPEPPEEQAARAAGRPARQQAYIARWGYPLVLEEFRFHLTLTNRLPENPMLPAARQYFAAAVSWPRQVESVSVYVEDTPGAFFRLSNRLPFGA